MKTKKFCVIGLGYFGSNLSLRLAEEGSEVIAIDNNEDKVNAISDKVTYAVCMDSTDQRAMRSLGLKDMDAVIVAIGEGFESSINTIAVLQELGVRRILGRIISPIHERLLKLMNIQELLVPEAEAANHLSSRLMITGLLEVFEISKVYSIFEIETPKSFAGKAVVDIQLRQKYSLNLVTIKRKKSKRLLALNPTDEFEVLGVPTPDLVIMEDDVLVLFGKDKDFLELIGSI